MNGDLLTALLAAAICLGVSGCFEQKACPPVPTEPVYRCTYWVGGTKLDISCAACDANAGRTAGNDVCYYEEVKT